MAQQAIAPTHQQVASNQQKSGTRGNIGARYFGALVLVGVIIQIPLVAVVLTLAVYLVPGPSLARIDPFELGSVVMALLLGIIITLLFWLLLALFFMYFASAEGGRSLSYDSIKIEFDTLKARYEIVKGVDTYATLTEQEKVALTEEEKARCIALADVDQNICAIDQTLRSDGLQWVLNTGYVSVWKNIYNAKETMTCLLPPTVLVDDAKYDESRLQGSDIPDHDNLLILLQNAIAVLSPPSAPTIPTQSLQQQQPQQTEAQARTDIRKVSYVIHRFTSERWEGLLRTRNQLMGTALLTGIFTYNLLAVALLAGVSPVQIRQIIVFYFLGVIVGLFGRLATENQTDSVVDDYGLTMSRILVTPLLSGLAALVGVFLVAIVSIELVTASATIHGQVIPLGSIYDYTTYPQNLFFAAIFGFVPNLVINVLQQKSEDVKSEIRSSSPADTSTGRGSAGKGSRGTGGSGKNQVGTGTGQLNNLTSQLNNLSSQLSGLTGPLSSGTGSGQPGSSVTGLLSDGAGPGQPGGGTTSQSAGGPDPGQSSP